VGQFDVVGINGRIARTAGGQRLRDLGIVERDADDEGAVAMPFDATASPEVCTWPVAIACRTLSTLPL
jgi:hypothetical protein